MSRSKLNRGDYLVRKAIKQLGIEGFRCEKSKKIRWAQQDFWGLWDILAIKPDNLRMIQVSQKYFSQKPKEFQEAALRFPVVSDMTKEYWRPKNDGTWDIKYL